MLWTQNRQSSVTAKDTLWIIAWTALLRFGSHATHLSVEVSASAFQVKKTFEVNREGQLEEVFLALRILGLSMAGVGPETETQGSGAEPNPICLKARILRVEKRKGIAGAGPLKKCFFVWPQKAVKGCPFNHPLGVLIVFLCEVWLEYGRTRQKCSTCSSCQKALCKKMICLRPEASSEPTQKQTAFLHMPKNPAFRLVQLDGREMKRQCGRQQFALQGSRRKGRHGTAGTAAGRHVTDAFGRQVMKSS